MTDIEPGSPEASAPAPRAKRATRKPNVDWLLIRKRFEAGLTLADCAHGQEISGESVRYRAKSEGWQRKIGKPSAKPEIAATLANLPSLQDATLLTPSRTPQKASTILQALTSGTGYGRAAALAGLSLPTLQAWLKDDPAFNKACENARAQIISRVENSLYATAAAGDVAAQKFVLKTAKETRSEYQEDEVKPSVSVILSFRHGDTDSALPSSSPALELEALDITPATPAPAAAPEADLIDRD